MFFRKLYNRVGNLEAKLFDEVRAHNDLALKVEQEHIKFKNESKEKIKALQKTLQKLCPCEKTEVKHAKELTQTVVEIITLVMPERFFTRAYVKECVVCGAIETITREQYLEGKKEEIERELLEKKAIKDIKEA